MKKIKLKKKIFLFIIIIFISLAIYIFTITKNTYLKCTSDKEKIFYIKIDRPHFAFIYENPYFIEGDWITMFDEIYTTEFDIVMRDKDPILGKQFFYDSMALNRFSLDLQSFPYGKIGNCIEIKKAKQKL